MEKKVSWQKMKELLVLQQVRKVGRVSQIKQQVLKQKIKLRAEVEIEIDPQKMEFVGQEGGLQKFEQKKK